MDCGETRKFLHSYLDRELDPAHNRALEEHAAGCGRCSQALESQRVLQQGLHHKSLYHSAPPELAGRLRAAIRKASPPPQSARMGFMGFWAWRWVAVAASFAVVVASGLIYRTQVARHSELEAMQQEIVSAHIRSLMAAHLTDVASSDQHTVKPWFAGKLDFSPPVNDLAQEGYPLVGGRLDYLASRPAAALVYERRKHLINLFVWPGGDKDQVPGKPQTRNGYNMLSWKQGGMTLWAVSDLNAAELANFAQLLKAKSSPSGGP